MECGVRADWVGGKGGEDGSPSLIHFSFCLRKSTDWERGWASMRVVASRLMDSVIGAGCLLRTCSPPPWPLPQLVVAAAVRECVCIVGGTSPDKWVLG
mmetsp:Transcript_37473/g.55015  ORF Transcript_37473/g.55015 Transcript_37473/m.55015 type:complete len:98 (+) Transcript_37473:1189-1482(+)